MANQSTTKPLPAPPSEIHPKSPSEEDRNSSDDHVEKSNSANTNTTTPKLMRRPTHVAIHKQSRFMAHKYVVRRPRALQVEYHGEVVCVGDFGRVDGGLLESRQQTELNLELSESSASDNSGPAQERTTDNVNKQRERLELFIDLIWVGIVSNLSEFYYDQEFIEQGSVKTAAAIFIVLFLASWQIWSRLQMFLNSYFMDDSPQRILIIWVLVLGVAWGNNSVYTLDGKPGSNLLIAFYLVASNSIVLMEYIYSFWLPWLRPLLRLSAILSLPSTALWTCAMIYKGKLQFGLIWAAVAYDKLCTLFVTTPFAKRLVHSEVRKAMDEKHTRSRYECFLIIALGEGVILLIRGSPLGKGITIQLARAVMSLTLYYCIYSFYFMGDMSKTSVHPVHRRWWIRAIWQFLHVIYFGAIILLSSTLSYLVKYVYPQPEHGDAKEARSENGETKESSFNYTSLHTAIVTAYACFAIIMLLSLVFALLVRPVDPPKTLVVNNRYIRLAPRALSVPVLATMWLAPITAPSEAIGYMNSISWIVFFWEWSTSMETGCKFMEPKDVDT